MPGFNRTGPNGQGPVTGKRMGACASSDFPENGMHFNAGRGFGRGRQGGYAGRRGMGMGQGFRNRNFENIPEVSEKTIIENEINSLKHQLSFLEDKLSKTKEV